MSNPRPLSPILLCFAFLVAPLLAQPTKPDPRATRDFTRVFGGSGQKADAPGLQQARAQWPAIQEDIDRHSKTQDEAFKAGGRELERTIALYRGRCMSGAALDFYLAGRVLGLADRLDEARDNFEKALQKDKYFYWAEHALGTYYYRRKLWETAAKHYQGALELQQGHLRSAKGLAFCLMFMKRYPQAVDLMEQIRVVSPNDVEVLLALANVHMFLVDYEASLAVLEELKRVRPKDGEVARMIVRCHEKSGQPEKALLELERHLAVNKSDWQGWALKANLLRDLGRLHECAGALERLLENLPADNKAVDQDRVRQQIEGLMKGPATVRPRPPGTKTPEEWIKILLNSSETRRRQRAARILSRSPDYNQEIFVAFIRSLLDKTKDPVVRTLALKYIDKWTPEEALPDLVPLLTTLLRGAKDWRVQGMTAHLLGKTGHPSVVPPLVQSLRLVNHPYAFRQVHGALDRLTYAYFLLEDSQELNAKTMDELGSKWEKWYEKNRDRYVRYEKQR